MGVLSDLDKGGGAMAREIVDKKDIELNKVLEQFKDRKGSLIPALQATQEIYGYLPKEAMKKISEVLRVPFGEVFGVATFYAQFRLQPRGRNIVRVCTGTACYVSGGPSILETIQEELGISKGETTEDLRFTIEPVACLGACGLAPCMMVNDESFGRLTKGKVKKILAQFD